MQTTTDATINGSVWNDGTHHVGATAGQSFGPLSFKYTTKSISVPPTGRIAGRYVFSWYLAYHGTYGDQFGQGFNNPTWINYYKQEMADAIASGVDGWELDYINRFPDQYNAIYAIFQAAQQIYAADTTKTPFWLYLSPELGGSGSAGATISSGPGAGQNWILYLLQQFVGSTNYYKINGKPVLGSFLGAADATNQSQLTNLVFGPMGGAGSVFYVPALFNSGGITTDGVHLNAWAQANLGSVRNWTGDTDSNDIGSTNALVNVCVQSGKPVVCGVGSSEYWGTQGDVGHYQERNGGEGPANEYEYNSAKPDLRFRNYVERLG